MKKIFDRKTVVSLLLIIILSGWLYKSSFTSYFFQDDWFSFQISQADNLSSFLTFFLPRQDVIYYRPLGMQVPFFILRSLFGINPLPYRLFTFTTYGLNIVLVYIITLLILKKKYLSLLSGFFYATSAIHFITLYWFAIYAFVLGPSAFFLSFIFFILYCTRKKRIFYILSVCVFILGLMVNEMVIVLPVIIFLYALLLMKKLIVKQLLPYIFTGALLFSVRFLFYNPPSEGAYSLALGKNVLSNIKTYILWSFNWSEILTEQMVRLFVFNDKILNNYPTYALTAIATFYIFLLLVYIPSFIIFRNKLKLHMAKTLFFILWFILGLTPVLPFAHHKFPYYLPISLTAFIMFMLILYNFVFKYLREKSKLAAYCFTVLLMTNWMIISYATLDLNKSIHWAPRRAYIAQKFVEKAKKTDTLDIISNNTYIIPDSSENRLSLNDQDALIVVFGKSNISTLYK